MLAVCCNWALLSVSTHPYPLKEIDRDLLLPTRGDGSGELVIDADTAGALAAACIAASSTCSWGAGRPMSFSTCMYCTPPPRLMTKTPPCNAGMQGWRSRSLHKAAGNLWIPGGLLQSATLFSRGLPTEKFLPMNWDMSIFTAFLACVWRCSRAWIKPTASAQQPDA
jgi:hypothetical protein